MSKDNDSLKSSMIEKIYAGGAWFTTRENNYLRIAFSEGMGVLCCRECVLRDGELRGKAYTFGTDWFDISFHGRLTDIYVDPDTFRAWDIRYDRDRGTYYDSSGDGPVPSRELIEFCKASDEEALAGISDAFSIDGAGFAEEIVPSELKMGRSKGIRSLVKGLGGKGNE